VKKNIIFAKQVSVQGACHH